MRLPKDLLLDIYTSPQLFLCEVDKEKICKLEATNRKASLKFNSLSELSFDVARVYNDVVTGETKDNPFFDKIEALRLILVENVGYFELQGPELIGDGIEEKKSCTAYSLEYILSQKFLTNFNINTGKVDSLEVLNAANPDKIVPIVLYDPTNKNLSLLHLALEKVYGWRIGHVDKQLQTLSRQFEIERESVYDFLMNEICEKFNCYVVFDTFENTINLYAESPTAKFIGNGVSWIFKIGSRTTGTEPFSAIETVSIDGYKTTRWSYTIVDNEGVLVLEDVPSGGAIIEVVGTDSTWETDVFISYDNLSKEINVNYDADSIKTVLTVTYGDDEDIRETNLGLPYLTDLSFYYTVDWMGQDLYDAYTVYLEKSNSSQAEYTNNSKEILKINDQIYYEENRLSLEYSMVEVDSSTVGTYYTRHKNADGSYYYTEVSLPSEYIAGAIYYSNASTNVQDGETGNVSALYSSIRKYYHNYFAKKYQDERNEQDENYASYVPNMDEAIQELKDLHNRFLFAEEYTINNLANDLKNGSETEKEKSVRRFLDNIWVEIGRTPLKTTYLTAYEQVREANMQAGYSNKDNKDYGFYYPVTIFINSIQAAIAERDETIKGYESQKQVFVTANSEISNSLLMTNNFTSQQLIKLNAFLREDELHIDDIVETSLDNLSSSFKLKQDAMESGRIELKKLCQPQLQFTMDMANIYALTEFEPIVDKFQLGNIIKIKLRDAYTESFKIIGDGITANFMVPPAFDGIKNISTKANCSYNAQTGRLVFDAPPKNGEVIEVTLARYYIKQSRLLQVDINFDDFSDFSCEFGELTSLRTQSDIHADLLRNAISAGKSVASNSNYWTKGSDQATATDLKIQQGLLDATTQIKATDGTQGVVIDKYGIKLQKYNGDSIDPHQTWLVNNMILMTDDGWKTSRAGLGEFTVDGVTFYGLIAEAVLSGYIEGSKIVGGELYSTNYSGNVDSPKGTYVNLNTGDFELANGKMVYDDEKGKLTFKDVTIEWSTTNSPSISDIDGLGTRLDSLESSQGGSGYDDSKIEEIDKAVAEHLGLGGTTVLTENKIISPYIGGGYLNITNTDNNSRVVIDPNNLTENNYIFQVHNGDKVTVGVTAEGNAEFSGTITSASMIGGSIQSANYEKNVNGTYIGLDDGYFEVGGGSLVYSDNVITLGKQTNEDSESIIKLCGGLGEISFGYIEDEKYNSNLVIKSENFPIDIISKKQITLDCKDDLGVVANKTRFTMRKDYINMISYYDGDGDGVYDESSSSFELSYNGTYLYTPKIEFVLRDHANDKLYNILLANVANDTTEQNLIVGNNIGYTYIDGNHVILRTTNNGVRLRDHNSDSDTYNAFFMPDNKDEKTITLGTSSNPWYAVYANNSAIQTSDVRKKTNIIPLGENQISTFDLGGRTESIDVHSELFDRLQPVQYNFINDESRVHYGLVAQDVVAAMDELGIGENELDLVHHDYWIDEITGEEKESYGLAYNNLIAMLIHEVQKLKQK